MKNVTRRGFLAGSALTAGLVGLAGCNAGGAASDPLAAPAADKYPIEPDKDDVKAKWASEEVRDGWTKVTNEDGGAVLGVMDAARLSRSTATPSRTSTATASWTSTRTGASPSTSAPRPSPR